MQRRMERGQVLPLVALVIVAAGVAVLFVGRIGGAALDRARAATAADAAALAGAAEGKDAAATTAKANGGAVTSFEEVDGDTRVVVGVGDAEAVARARREGDRQARADADRAPALRAVLARARQLLGVPVPVVKEHGLEIEVPPAFVSALAPVAAAAGLCQPAPQSTPVRFAVCAAR